MDNTTKLQQLKKELDRVYAEICNSVRQLQLRNEMSELEELECEATLKWLEQEAAHLQQRIKAEEEASKN